MSDIQSVPTKQEKVRSQDSWFDHKHEDSLGAGYPIQQSFFSGPLHLLLSLLEKNKLAISEVNLVSITSSYWKELLELGQIQPQSMCDFLDVATRLMALKARFLRPEVGEAPELDPGQMDEQSLIAQLEQLKRFQFPVEDLKRRDQAGLHTHRRHVPLKLSQPEIVGQMESPALLLKALQRIARQLPRKQPATLIPKPLFPIENQIGKVLNSLRHWRTRFQKAPMSFFALFSASSHSAEFIANFLAVLELVRRRSISASQKKQFGDIQLVPIEE